MSSLTYEEYYQQALEDLASISKEDTNLTKLRVPPSGRNRYDLLLQYWTSLYIQYLRIAHRLSLVHDAQLQPQKRSDVRTLLDSCLGRVLELRALLTANCGEFAHMDDAMLDFKMTPDELEVPIPRYFIEDAASQLQERRRQIASLQTHYRETDPDAPVTRADAATHATDARKKSERNELTIDDAVAILQVNERGRQARQRAKFQLLMYLHQKQASHQAEDYNYATGKERAATVLQKAALAYLARKQTRTRHAAELELLGMRPTAATRSDAQRAAAEVRLEDRKSRQRLNAAEFQQKATELETRLRAEESPRTMEQMLSDVLTRMAYARMESRDDAPPFPPPEDGGSRRYLAAVDAAGGGRSASVADGGNATGTARAASTMRSSVGSVAPRKNTPGGGNMRRKNEEEEAVPAMAPSEFWGSIKSMDERYNGVWRPRFEESYLKNGDLDQKADEELLRRQLMEGPRGIMEEIRQIVDQLIFTEVENLKKRLEQERRGKKKKGGKKGGKKKGPRKPKLKDPTKGVDIETFMNSAVHQNVLKLPQADVYLTDYIGRAAVHATPLDQMLRIQKPDDEMRKKWQRILLNWDANVEGVMKMKKEAFQKLYDKYLIQSSWVSEPSAAQVRQSVTEYAILPLGSQVIHDLAPNAKTLLLYGFPKNGKTLLVHAICNHSGANLFDLSPSNFETNTGLGSIIQMVFHLAKVMAPSVIMIDKVEKIFMKKKKKKGPKDPLALRGKKMKKELVKGINGLAPTDRVIVIGTSSAPWEGDFNPMVNTFAHMVYCANPDYASRLALLQKLIACKTGDSDTLKPEHYHELVILTEGLTCGDIGQIVESVLSERRLRRLSQRPIAAADFLRAITVAKPATVEEQTMMREFNQRLPLHLRRLNPPVDLPPPEKDGGKKKKKKK